jgi:hypothetical protein
MKRDAERPARCEQTPDRSFAQRVQEEASNAVAAAAKARADAKKA